MTTTAVQEVYEIQQVLLQTGQVEALK